MMNNNANMMVENTDYPNAIPTTAGIGGNQNNNNNCCRTSSCNTTPRIPVYSYDLLILELRKLVKKNKKPEKKCFKKFVV